MPCPNCGSDDVWDDNLHWGCNKCRWCSLAGLNSTRTPSAPYSATPDYSEVEQRARDWAARDANASKFKNCPGCGHIYGYTNSSYPNENGHCHWCVAEGNHGE